LLNQSSRKFTVDFDGEISVNYVRQQLEDKEIELSCGAASFAEGDMVWHKERHLGQVIELNWKSEQAVEDDPTGEWRKKENAIDPRKPIVILFGEAALKNYTNAERLEMRGQVVCCGSYIRKDRACPAWSFATLCAACMCCVSHVAQHAPAECGVVVVIFYLRKRSAFALQRWRLFAYADVNRNRLQKIEGAHRYKSSSLRKKLEKVKPLGSVKEDDRCVATVDRWARPIFSRVTAIRFD
jgi:hypothetical protein